MTAKHDCSARIWKDHRSMWGPCSRPAAIEREGQWWCWQHDPERMKIEEKTRLATREAKMDREAAKYARIARNVKLGPLVTEETAALLERLAEYTIVHWADEYRKDAESADALAASIREILDEH